MSNDRPATLSSDVLVRTIDLGKRFTLHTDDRNPARMVRLWRELAGMRPPTTPDRPEDFWALRGIDLELRRGEGLGVLGHNGAGKSTLIKLLMGRLRPTTGSIEITGRVSAVTQLGVGFNPALSGRKNIFLNAALLGLTHQETVALIERIIDFAEIGQFIDQPIRTYSSGMLARLGYAVSAFIHPDVLLIDEVLAVGDLAFRRKCMRHIQEFRAAGGALLFVSHDLYALQFVCDRVIVLERGRAVFTGDVVEGTRRYLESMQHTEATEQAEMEHAARGDESSLPEISDTTGLTDGLRADESAEAAPTERVDVSAAVANLPSRADRPLSREHPLLIDAISIVPLGVERIQTGESVRLVMQVRVLNRLPPIRWGFPIVTADGVQNIATLMFEGLELESGRYELSVVAHEFPLLAGRYGLRAGVVDSQHGIPYDDFGYQDSPISFSVWTPPDGLSGVRAVMGDLIHIAANPESPCLLNT